MEKVFFETSPINYGWVYGVESGRRGRVRAFRFWANGATNGPREFGEWTDYKGPLDAETCKKLFHNGVVSY